MQESTSTMQSWRRGMAGLVLGLMAGSAWAGPVAEVWKDPNCGCCTAWAEHLEQAGFDVQLHASREMGAVKAEHGVPQRLASCHTAVIDGYVIEGHVPATDIQRLLDSGADVSGLAVPGMPHGSPGMETGRVDDYTVYAWQEGGDIDVYQRYTHES
ncbi:DUF411 domain-containing protein [Halomonas sp. McH1-25]|uniref:DUF411 domain-containing protein n=2 Tax=Halomonas TaxID=2745 RepID=UPI001EF43B05|nr:MULTISPECIES: DUF411 domain-containing protein [unclassified Halomonas]MCG7601203.1 DUF411 domain-containing protein [Halomonas sp. McH1-25]MCP1360158.1 DUF411 domain-containing protein [Halomonas sp. BBD45]